MTAPSTSSVEDKPQAGLLDQLRERLRSGAALPAERILCSELGVTRHALRLALEKLRTAGELERQQPRQLSVLERGGAALVHGTNPVEVIELRLALEPVLARLAALRASPLDIARIERAATTLEETESASADLAFHKSIAAATRNTLAADIYALVRQIGADARIHLKAAKPRPTNRVRQRDSEHMTIAAAIAARDPDAAERAMRSHLHMVQRQILDQVSFIPEPSARENEDPGGL